MDLIECLERAAVEADALWRFGPAQDLRGSEGTQTEVTFCDNAVLARLLEARPTMICMVATPDGGDTEETEDPPAAPEPGEESPDGRSPDESFPN